jgi:hypothetical protein
MRRFSVDTVGGVSEETLRLSLLWVSEETIRDPVALLSKAMCRYMSGISPHLFGSLPGRFVHGLP